MLWRRIVFRAFGVTCLSENELVPLQCIVFSGRACPPLLKRRFSVEATAGKPAR